MRLPSRKIALITTLALAFSTAEAARDTTTFPVLKWLRDSAVEAFFGKSSSATKHQEYPSPELYTYHRDDIIVRFNVTTPDEERALAKAAQQLLLDVWAFTPEYVDVMVYKPQFSAMLRVLPKSLQTPFILIPDVAAAAWATFPSQAPDKPSLSPSRIDADLPSMMRTSSDGIDNIFFKEYQPLPVITRWMHLLEAMFPTITEMTSIGKSYEGKEIHALRVGSRLSEDGDQVRKTILVTGGLHGREWISTSTVTYLMWSVIIAYGKEPMITKLLDKFDIVFVPILNPDGYEYTWSTNRLWRKSRQQTPMRFCKGFDLDHTFGYAWESSNNQVDPCSESYGGESPFQAVEASALANWAKNQTEHGVKFIGFLDLHSYSQQILFPYTHSCSADPPNLENLMELGVGLAKAIRLSSGETYSVDSACEGAVASSSKSPSESPRRVESGGGSAIDWFYHELGARYSYQIKLRDTGSYGFLLPSEHIIPTGEEMLNALKYFGDFLLGNNGIEKGSSHFSPPPEQWRDLKRRKR